VGTPRQKLVMTETIDLLSTASSVRRYPQGEPGRSFEESSPRRAKIHEDQADRCRARRTLRGHHRARDDGKRSCWPSAGGAHTAAGRARRGPGQGRLPADRSTQYDQKKCWSSVGRLRVGAAIQIADETAAEVAIFIAGPSRTLRPSTSRIDAHLKSGRIKASCRPSCSR